MSNEQNPERSAATAAQSRLCCWLPKTQKTAEIFDFPDLAVLLHRKEADKA